MSEDNLTLGSEADLQLFISARLNEREAEANRLQSALDSGWNYFDEPGDYDAARMLRDVQSKRAILAWAVDFMEHDYAPWNVTCLQLLALPDSGHPDYRAEWMPSRSEV